MLARQLLTGMAERRQALRLAVTEARVQDILAIAPLSLLAGNVNLVTSDERVVVAQRSGMDMTFKNEWNLGINEGMKVTGEGTETEDFFGLAARALTEELAVPESALDAIVVNWFGYCLACSNFYTYAHARTSWTADQVEQNRLHAKDTRELRHVVYPKVTDGLLAALSRGDTIPEVGDEKWLHHAGLSAKMLSAALSQI